MCGISGFTGGHDLRLLKKMNRTLTHRGPDDEGYYLKQGIGLAMRRLSIIDVECGQQPMANEDGTVWTVFNGEIYNFKELRRELEKKGHEFRTDHSDTETIVHAYEEYGPAFVNHLNGMFAIAVWDERKRKLLLYRDRLGEKPLYYWMDRGQIYFASEIKALLALPFFAKRMNPTALFYYLSLKHAPRSDSFFEGIQSLGPGEYLIFQKGRLRKSVYWEINTSPVLKISEEDAIDQLLKLLKDSTRMRMVSDVPLGAYLSGGVDSSTVVGLMSRIRRKPMETFALTYHDDLSHKMQDEYWAQKMANKFHTRHRIHRMQFAEFEQELDGILQSFDEPFGGTLSTYFLSKLIKKHVTVAVSGDGADELFGSYRVHRLAYPLHYLGRFKRQGKDLRALSSADLRQLWPYAENLDQLESLVEDHPYAWHAKLGVFQDREKKDLFSTALKRKTKQLSMRRYYKKAYQRVRSEDVLNQVLQVECQNLLPDQVLNFVDRLSMAHSIEVRPPFLDHRLVEFASRLPGHYKIRPGHTKYILKRAAERLLPRKLIDRPKEGFVLPYLFWMRKYMYAKISLTLRPSEIKRHGLFQPSAVERMLRAYRSGDDSISNKIYLLYIFQRWWKQHWG